MDKDVDNEYFFKVDKGFLKNTYTAVFNFNANDSELNMDDDESINFEDDDLLPDEDDSLLDNEDIDNSLDDLDYSSLMSSMDLKFNVTLPYSAISNNATTKENNNKTLSWVLSSTDLSTIEFKFEIINMNVIYIGIGIVALIIILVVLMLTKKKNKKENIINNNEIVVTNDNSNDNVTPIDKTLDTNPLTIDESKNIV